MRKKNTISRQRMSQILREEIAAFKLQEEILLSEHQKLVDQRQDFQSILALCLAEQITGKRITDPMVIEEGVWSKIKYYMGKLGSLEKGGKFTLRRGKAEAEAYADMVAPALENAADDTVKKLVKQIEEEYPEFPNMEHNEEFSGALQQIGVAYDTVVAASESGEMEAAQANALIDQLKEVVKYFLDYKLSDVYKHLKEEEELDENKIIEEARLDRLLKKMAFGEPSKRAVRIVKRIADRAAKSGDKAGKLGKIRDALVDTPHANIADRAIKTYRRVAQAGTAVGGAASAAGGGGAASAAGGGGAASAAGGGGAASAAGGAAPNLGTSALLPAATTKTVGTGATSLATGAAVAYWASVLGVAAVTSGAAVMLLRKLKTDHRKSQFEAFLNTMENVPSDTPETDEMLGQPTSGETEDGRGGEPDGEAAGKGDVYVFKGKGGKGMQSQLAKAGIKGPEMSALLKGLRADLSAAGFNVLEEAIFGSVLAEISKEKLAKMVGARAAQKAQQAGGKPGYVPQQTPAPGEETVQPGAGGQVLALDNTLAALKQIKDPAQKAAAIKIVAQTLRQHGTLPPGFEADAAPAAPGGETPPGKPDAPTDQTDDMGKTDVSPGGETPPGKPDAPTDQTDDMGKTDVSPGGEAAPGEEKCQPGYTRNKAGACVPFGTPGINETLTRWHKLAGIIKG